MLASRRLGWQSPVYLDELRRADIHVPRLTGIYFWDNAWFLGALARNAAEKLMFAPSYRPARHHFLSRVATPERLRRHAKMVQNTMLRAPVDFVGNAQVYVRNLAPLVRSGRWHVLLFEEPHHPWLERQRWYRWRVRGYRATIREICRRAGASHWDYRKELTLAGRDFADLYHPNNRAAMERFSAALTEQAAVRLRRRYLHRSQP